MYNYLKHINFISKFNEKFKADDLSLVLEVPIWNGYKMSYLDIESVLRCDYDKQKLKRIVMLSVEMIQNIIKHRDVVDNEEESIFFIVKKDKEIILVSGNIVNDEHYQKIKCRIDHINSLSKEELNELYFNVLNTKGFTEKGGASLGLIEMARKTGNKIDYVINRINEKYSYIYTIVTYNVS